MKLSQVSTSKSGVSKITSAAPTLQQPPAMSPTRSKEDVGLQVMWEDLMNGDWDPEYQYKHCAVLTISWDADLDDLDTLNEVDQFSGVFFLLS